MAKQRLYKEFSFYDCYANFIKVHELLIKYKDSVYWRIYYSNKDSNWIGFFPFSEHHGGGQEYIIKIGNHDFDKWISNNKDFTVDIRKIIEKNKYAT
jgi:hypothetical protein